VEYEIEDYPRQMDDDDALHLDPPSKQRDTGKRPHRLRPLVPSQDQAVFIPEEEQRA
jgi:hypothetical protein